MLNIVEQEEGPVSIVAPAGRLDAVTSPELEQRLEAMLSEGRVRIILSLGGLDFVSSAGLRVFLAFAKKIKKAGGRMALCCARPAVMEVFETAGFTAILAILPTQEEAIKALQ